MHRILSRIRIALALALAVAAISPSKSFADSKPATFALTDTLRLDARVRTGVLPNGLRYFIRANHKPEKRVTLRRELGQEAVGESRADLTCNACA